MSIGERIQYARSHRGYSQVQLANMIGVTRGACGQWERGISSPNIENLSRLALILNVAFEWLATGRGQMEPRGRVTETQANYANQQVLSDQQRELLAGFARLSQNKRDALVRFLQKG